MKRRAVVARRLVLVAALASALGAACGSPDGEFAPNRVATGGEGVQNGFCDAAAVIEQKCVRCHSEPPAHGAPFALVGYADITAPSPSPSDPARTRADRMLAAVESGYMPYTALALDPPVEPLTCEERTTLVTWLEAGAEPPAGGDDGCASRAPVLLACDETL